MRRRVRRTSANYQQRGATGGATNLVVAQHLAAAARGRLAQREHRRTQGAAEVRAGEEEAQEAAASEKSTDCYFFE